MPEPNYALIRYQADNIPTFDGNPKHINRFISSCENFFTAHKDLTNPAAAINTCLFDTVLNKLTGRAADLVASRVELTSWELLKQSIISTFADQRSIDCVVQDIICCRPKKDESPQQFGLRLQDIRSLLFSKINVSSDPKELKLLRISEYSNLVLKTFINGLNYQMQLIVRIKSPKTLEEAMSLALEEENFMNYKNRNFDSKPTPQHQTHTPNQNTNTQQTFRPQFNNHNRYFATPRRQIFNKFPQNPHTFNNNNNPQFRQFHPGYPFRPPQPQQNFNQQPYNNFNNFNNRNQNNFNHNNKRPATSSIVRQNNFNRGEPMDTSSGNTVIHNAIQAQGNPKFTLENHSNENYQSSQENQFNYHYNDQSHDNSDYTQEYDYNNYYDQCGNEYLDYEPNYDTQNNSNYDAPDQSNSNENFQESLNPNDVT